MRQHKDKEPLANELVLVTCKRCSRDAAEVLTGHRPDLSYSIRCAVCGEETYKGHATQYEASKEWNETDMRSIVGRPPTPAGATRWSLAFKSGYKSNVEGAGGIECGMAGELVVRDEDGHIVALIAPGQWSEAVAQNQSIKVTTASLKPDKKAKTKHKRNILGMW